MEASFAVNTTWKELSYGCSSNATDEYIPCNLTELIFNAPCNYSALLNCTAVNSTLPVVHSVDSTAYQETINPSALYTGYVRIAMTLLLGVIGNVIVINVVGHLKKKRNAEDIYVLSLALTDIVASLVFSTDIVIIIADICDGDC